MAYQGPYRGPEESEESWEMRRASNTSPQLDPQNDVGM
jgi:hypothetical protein